MTVSEMQERTAVSEKRVLGDYTLIKQIGQGSLGTVFLGEHRFMKLPYVLKILPDELAEDRGFVQRFEHYVGMLATLDHPNIVKVHNVSHAEGRYFLVTDCIVDSLGETTNLTQYLGNGGRSLKEEELLNIVQQIADALDFAHQTKYGKDEKVAHLNLKPNNILIGNDGEKVKVCVSDFGLSRIIGIGAILTRNYKVFAEVLGISWVLQSGNQDRFVPLGEDSSKINQLHLSFLQNVSCLAPEQKSLTRAKEVGIQADAYAFGVLMYFLLIGEYPEGIFEMPSKKRPDLKKNWDLLIWNCLQKEPDRRPRGLTEALNQMLTEKRTLPFSHLSSSSPSPTEGKKQKPPEPNLSRTVQLAEKKAHQPPILPSTKNVKPKALKPVLQSNRVTRPTYDPDPGAALQLEANVTTYHPQPIELQSIEPILTDMVVIKGGTFFRGSQDGNRDEMPRHQITVESFAIDLHPITNEQFIRFLEYMGGEKDSSNRDIMRVKESRTKRHSGQLSIESGYGKHPVTGITWYGAVAYAQWVGKRLPTEAEWEIAALGGKETVSYATGDTVEKTKSNFFSSDTTPVKSYPPNGCGLYDMVGNVYEWCQDWYGYNYYEESAQEPHYPRGPLQGVYRVVRGGCWKSLKEDLRCSHRHRNNPGTSNSTYGFRCVTDVE